MRLAGQWDWNSPQQVQQGCLDWPLLNSSAGACPDHPCYALLLQIHLTLPSLSLASSTSLEASLCKRRAEQMDEHQKTSVHSSEASPALLFECVTSHDSVQAPAAESPPWSARLLRSWRPPLTRGLLPSPRPTGDSLPAPTPYSNTPEHPIPPPQVAGKLP